MNKLIIDSSTSHYFTLGLEDDYKVFPLIYKSSYSRDDLIHEIYCKNKPEIVYIGEGPGSFTGLRNLFAYFSIIAKISNVKVYSLPSLDIWRTALDPHHTFDHFIVTLNRKLGFLQKSRNSFELIERAEASKESIIFDPSGYWETEPIKIDISSSNYGPWLELLEQGKPINVFRPEYGYELDFLKKN